MQEKTINKAKWGLWKDSDKTNDKKERGKTVLGMKRSIITGKIEI